MGHESGLSVRNQNLSRVQLIGFSRPVQQFLLDVPVNPAINDQALQDVIDALCYARCDAVTLDANDVCLLNHSL